MDKSDNISLIEARPRSSILARYVEKYQFYRFDQPHWMQTIPNARMEYWYIYKGGFNIWNEQTQTSVAAPKIGGYPATSSPLLFHIPHRLYCLNLKLRLNTLVLPAFQVFESTTSLIDSPLFESRTIPPLSTIVHGEIIQVDMLDDWLAPLFSTTPFDTRIDLTLAALSDPNIQSVKELASILHYSPRQLQRMMSSLFGREPKELLNIFRFSQTAAYLKEATDSAFMEALSFGYCDQSHFIRECKKMTGVSPRELFHYMTLSTPDLMLFDKMIN